MIHASLYTMSNKTWTPVTFWHNFNTAVMSVLLGVKKLYLILN